MMFRGAYHQAIVEERLGRSRMRALMISGWLLTVLLTVVMFGLAMVWVLGSLGQG